ILVYPPTGKGAIEITAGDYRRLEPDEYFNDTLIEFGMKRAFHRMQETNPTLAEQVHLFNSFFYGKLSSKLPSDGYQSVRKWTSKFNFFDKNYIVIPINEKYVLVNSSGDVSECLLAAVSTGIFASSTTQRIRFPHKPPLQSLWPRQRRLLVLVWLHNSQINPKQPLQRVPDPAHSRSPSLARNK
ncbi:uncharacterized protein EI90DRAFT_2906174, partial [Cantharellus anzutake]|uniref:uncharacterized protein n=1 Tax=Cantharellus anzutake TaxID=1750568 RepID=UPI0019050D19